MTINTLSMLLALVMGLAGGQTLAVMALDNGSDQALELGGFRAVVMEVLSRYPQRVWPSNFFPTGVKKMRETLHDDQLQIVINRDGMHLQRGEQSKFFPYPKNPDKSPEPWMAWSYAVIEFLHGVYKGSQINALEVLLLDSMLKSLDWKSGFVHVNRQVTNADLENVYGMQFGVYRNRIYVAAMVKDIEKFDIAIGDQLVKINDADVQPGNFNAIYQLASRQNDGNITFTLQSRQKGRQYAVKLTGKYSKPVPIESRPMDGYLYIRIRSFEMDTHDFLRSILRANKSGTKGFIIDLRGNSGGVLETVAACADYFLDKGVIYYQEGQGQKILAKIQATPRRLVRQPVVVLIDQFTASGAEVFAAALAENHVGSLIGTRSNGYGLVHTLIPLPNGNILKTVTSRLLTPDKHAIGTGVKPSYCTSHPIDRQNIDLNKLHAGPCPARLGASPMDLRVAKKVLTGGR